jgi:hypothetical protein
MARNKKTYKKHYRKRTLSQHNIMTGGSILGDLKSNFDTLKNTFTNDVTTQVMTNFSLYKERAMERFNKAKDIFTRKMNCFKT